MQLAGDPLGMSASALEMLEPRAATSQHPVKVLGPRSGDFSHPKEAQTRRSWGWFSHCGNRNIWDVTWDLLYQGALWFHALKETQGSPS